MHKKIARFNLHLGQCLILATFLFGLLGNLSFLQAEETSLTDQEKTARRLQFNQYVESELAAARQRQEQEAKKIWKFNLESNFGYDNNVNLDSSRQGDEYYENNLSGELKLKHPGVGFLGEGSWGAVSSANFFHYGNFEDSSYSDLGLNPFFDAKLSPKLKFKFNYYLNHIHYERNSSLNYTQNKFKPALSYDFTRKLTGTFYQIFSIRSFATRQALSDSNENLDKEREDIFYEPGVNLKYILNERLVLGAHTAYKANDSNDLFNRFNDYQGMKAGGYANLVLAPRLSTTFYTGYDFKKYTARTFDVDGLVKEKDNLLYYGSTVYFEINPTYQWNFSYLYKQNYSNDVSQDYSGHTLSTGLTATF